MISYAITDPLYYSADPKTLKIRAAGLLSSRPVDMIVLRDKTTNDYESLARAFLSLKTEFPAVKFLLHRDIALASSLGADGIHLTSAQIEDIPAAKEASFWTIASTHTPAEAALAESLGADAITFSPVFATPGKGRPAGLEKLKEIRDKISIKLIALGGIVADEQIEAVIRTGADAFASIRLFAP